MAITAPIDKDGNLVTDLYETEATKKRESNDTLGKEAFLQLLVAQMQNQDPLEPMENTEYVTQLATFSQLEALQNMESSLSSGQAANLVGKAVIVTSTSAVTGETSSVLGIVDYVTYENGSAYLIINEEKYAYEDLDKVLSDDYVKRMEDMEMAKAVISYINDLPAANDADLSVADKVKIARQAYDGLSDEQKLYISDEYVTKLKDLETLMSKLSGKTDEKTENEAGAGKTENSEGTESEE